MAEAEPLCSLLCSWVRAAGHGLASQVRLCAAGAAIDWIVPDSRGLQTVVACKCPLFQRTSNTLLCEYSLVLWSVFQHRTPVPHFHLTTAGRDTQTQVRILLMILFGQQGRELRFRDR